MIAALFVETEGVYFDDPDIDPWDKTRDARRYAGPYPVVAHPPCERWGRYWHGSPIKPHRFQKGADGGCFAMALTAVRNFGGVLEHPKGSLAWDWFGLRRPPPEGGWIPADNFDGWTCCVDQGHYGHFTSKSTWLYSVGRRPPRLIWGRAKVVIPRWMIRRYGERRARHIGLIAMIGGDAETVKRLRGATPIPFRDLLLSIAREAG